LQRFDELTESIFAADIYKGVAKVRKAAQTSYLFVDEITLRRDATRLLRERVRQLVIGALLAFGFERKSHIAETLLPALTVAIERDGGYCFRNEFSELSRCVAVVCDSLSDQLVRIIKRFGNDRNDLEHVFALRNGRLESIVSAASDHHEGQSAVFLLRVSEQLLVYKPKSLDADVLFQDVLSKLSASVPGLDFLRMTILNRADYGWMSFVDYAPCADIQELSRFYVRLGYMLAALAALRSCDHHYDNLIAHQSHPQLIDLECSFTPGLIIDRGQPSRMSLRRVGVISHLDRVGDIEIDKGALAWRVGTSTLVLTWSGWGGTGPPELEYKKRIIDRCLNDPRKPGSILGSKQFRKFLFDGFKSGRRLIRNLSGDLKPVLLSMHEKPMRLVVRSTRFYRELLMLSLSPQFCKSSDARRALLCGYLKEDDQRLAPLVVQEVASLMEGEIPHFRHIPGERLVLSNGQLIKHVVQIPGLELVLRDLAGPPRENWPRSPSYE
jgi:lantibiotic modifying enzyme